MRLKKMAADPTPYLRKTEKLAAERTTDAYKEASELLAELREALAGSNQSDSPPPDRRAAPPRLREEVTPAKGCRHELAPACFSLNVGGFPPLTIALHQRQHRPANCCRQQWPDGYNSGQFGRQYPHVGNRTGICSAFGGKLRISRVFRGCSGPVLSADGGLPSSPILAEN